MIGNYRNKLDDKSRLTLPAKLRNELGADIVISAAFDNTLEIRTAKDFKDWMDTLTSKGNLSSNARQLQRLILGNSFEIKVDKAGRVLVPKELLTLAGVKKDVVLVAIGDKVEVHDAKQWDNLMSDSKALTKSLEQLADELAKEIN